MTRKVRVELPVLLYVDVEVNVSGRGAGGLIKDVARNTVWQWIGRPGAEEGVDVPTPTQSRVSGARIYPSDHTWCDSRRHFDVVDEVDESDRTYTGKRKLV